MKAGTSLIIALLALTGCAKSQIALAPGQNGSIAILDPKTQAEIAVLDKPGSVADVAGAKAGKIATIDAATYEQQFGDLIRALPKEPRAFTLYFKENSIEPTEASAAEMPTIFQELKERSGADLQVTGHTDTVGSSAINDAFSLKRAAEITSYLFTLGLDKAIVRLAGRGERELKEQTPDETPSATNRRVEVLVR